jgi:hypothetical protein
MRENAFCAVVLIIGLGTARIARISSNKGRKSANVIIGDTEKGTSGYGNHATVLSVCHLPNWWIDTETNIHVCADISLFSSYQISVDDERFEYGCSWCWYDRSKVHFGKDRAAKERAACPLNK